MSIVDDSVEGGVDTGAMAALYTYKHGPGPFPRKRGFPKKSIVTEPISLRGDVVQIHGVVDQNG